MEILFVQILHCIFLINKTIEGKRITRCNCHKLQHFGENFGLELSKLQKAGR